MSSARGRLKLVFPLGTFISPIGTLFMCMPTSSLTDNNGNSDLSSQTSIAWDSSVYLTSNAFISNRESGFSSGMPYINSTQQEIVLGGKNYALTPSVPARVIDLPGCEDLNQENFQDQSSNTDAFTKQLSSELLLPNRIKPEQLRVNNNEETHDGAELPRLRYPVEFRFMKNRNPSKVNGFDEGEEEGEDDDEQRNFERKLALASSTFKHFEKKRKRRPKKNRLPLMKRRTRKPSHYSPITEYYRMLRTSPRKKQPKKEFEMRKMNVKVKKKRESISMPTKLSNIDWRIPPSTVINTFHPFLKDVNSTQEEEWIDSPYMTNKWTREKPPKNLHEKRINEIINFFARIDGTLGNALNERPLLRAYPIIYGSCDVRGTRIWHFAFGPPKTPSDKQPKEQRLYVLTFKEFDYDDNYDPEWFASWVKLEDYQNPVNHLYYNGTQWFTRIYRKEAYERLSDEEKYFHHLIHFRINPAEEKLR